ncbi:phycobiliprotein lyase [Nostoc sp. CCCryo 231-06]|nr:phycobiliprotein lyase [Nostoc sp. CCCryo 231-06]
MEITELFELSIRRARSHHSDHYLAFAHLEQVLSNTDIESLSVDKSAVVEICLDKSSTARRKSKGFNYGLFGCFE